ncbi:uncharacterized protein LOC119447090 isoform X1 [Dermacentor silvarum]|uniref:uncharacterized protein LOC119447090 isoform X1 n=1 Tax=Dermacentor silvarum TaxID=543639 RepID=UPI002100F16C|nr:uncharacterized protein LOC119447090 isoform X1 [Dermacentor silvarum]
MADLPAATATVRDVEFRVPPTADGVREVEFHVKPTAEGRQGSSVTVSVTTTSTAEPEAGPSRAEDLTFSDLPTANHVMDCVLAEFRARPVIHARLGNVPLPDFNAGEARVYSPRFWDLNAVFREGDAYMRASPYTSGQLPVEVRLRSRVACRDVKFQCDFAYSYFRGQVALSFEQVLIGVLLVLRGGFPDVKSLQVENIGDFDVSSLIGVPVVLKWLATKVIKKVIRDNSQVIARLASNEVKDVLQEAIGDQDLTSVLKDALAARDAAAKQASSDQLHSSA